MQIQKTQDIKNNYLKVLVYGPSGVGKTVFSGTSPKVLFLDSEGGLLSIKNKNIDFIKINTFSQIREIYPELLKKENAYETIVIDSLTEVAKKSMDAILNPTGARQEKDIANQHDWLQNIEQMRRMVRTFRDLPYNIIFTCLSRDEKSEVSGGMSRKPAVSAKSLSDDVCGYVDIVAYIDLNPEGKRLLLTQPHVNRQGYEIFGKDRSGKLSKFEEPDFGIFQKKIIAAAGTTPPPPTKTTLPPKQTDKPKPTPTPTPTPNQQAQTNNEDRLPRPDHLKGNQDG